MLANIQEEADRVLGQCKAEHIRNHALKASNGERIGLALIEMARKKYISFYEQFLECAMQIKLITWVSNYISNLFTSQFFITLTLAI